ncbi:MAG: 50S ribosomal protein L32e [Thermoplasmata archaeon]
MSEEANENEYEVKKKPSLGVETEDALKKRQNIKKRRPVFSRQEWFRHSKLEKGTWRRPKGVHSKARKNLKSRPPNVSIGFRSPKSARNLHPSGFREVLVYNVNDLEGINPDKDAVRIAHGVGMRKRIDIEQIAEEKGFRVLNKM